MARAQTTDASAPQGTSTLLPYQEYGTRPSKYDQYSSWLISSIVLVGLAVTLLFVMWLTSLDWSTSKEPMFVATPIIPNQNPEGVAEDFEEPGVEELADVQEPQLADAVEALTSDPSRQRAALEAVNGNKALQGSGKGLGDARTIGPGTGGQGGNNPEDRWDIRYSSKNKGEYFKQLEFFKIELAAVVTDADLISYASDLTAATPTKRTARRTEELRIKFRYREGFRLQLWDIEKMQAAGIKTKGRILMQFYPNQTAGVLLKLEKDKIGSVSIETIKTTTFGVRAKGGGFEYYVEDVKYR